MRITRSWVFIAVALLAACGGGEKQGKPAAHEGAKPAAEGEARVETHGFKSAQFGMTEQQVREAIAKDYHVAPEAVRAEENDQEKTHILAVTVPDVLPQGGTAEIAYAFGHTSGKLMQVGITWSAKTDPALTPERLMRNARLLAEHFKEAGYQPQSIATDVPLSDGMLVFRGTDKVGHATLLVLHEEGKAEAARQAASAPTALTLYYIADPLKPDIAPPSPSG